MIEILETTIEKCAALVQAIQNFKRINGTSTGDLEKITSIMTKRSARVANQMSISSVATESANVVMAIQQLQAAFEGTHFKTVFDLSCKKDQ